MRDQSLADAIEASRRHEPLCVLCNRSGLVNEDGSPALVTMQNPSVERKGQHYVAFIEPMPMHDACAQVALRRCFPYG